jgi:hypothetical protein
LWGNVVLVGGSVVVVATVVVGEGTVVVEPLGGGGGVVVVVPPGVVVVVVEGTVVVVLVVVEEGTVVVVVVVDVVVVVAGTVVVVVDVVVVVAGTVVVVVVPTPLRLRMENTPESNRSLPTATHGLLLEQLTPERPPSPVPSSATGLSVDQLQVPEAYVPVVVTPSSFASNPTAAHSVTEAQLTPYKTPVLVPSLATELSVDQLQVPEAYVPVVVTLSSELSRPTATHSVVEGQLTASKAPDPAPSSATGLSVDQLQAPEAYVPMVVTPSPAASPPAATHSVVEGQLTPYNGPTMTFP